MNPLEAREATILREVADALARHKLLVGVVLAVTVLSTYAGLQLVTEQYESVARLLVKLGRENTEVPLTVEKGGVLSTGVRKEEINSEVQLLASRDLIEVTIDEIGEGAFQYRPSVPGSFLESVKFQARRLVRHLKEQVNELLIAVNLRKRLSERDKAIVLIERSLKVEREKDSDVISARLRLADRELTVRFLGALVRNYLDRHVEVRRDASVSGFYEAQVESYRQRLGVIGAARQTVRKEHGVVSVVEQRALLLRRIRALQDEVEELEQERKLVVGGGPLESRTGAEGAPQEAAPPEPAVPRAALRALSAPGTYASPELLKRRLTELRIKRNELMQRYKSAAPVMVDVDDEIREVEKLMLGGVQSRIRAKRVEARALQAQLGRLNAGEKELDNVEEERQAAVQNFLVYSKRLEEARISEELDRRRVSNISVLAAPERPIEAVYPEKLLFVGVSAPFGLVLGIGLALLLEYLNRTIRSARDLKALGDAPFLGTLRLPRRARPERGLRRVLRLTARRADEAP